MGNIKDRLNLIMEAIGASNSEIAEAGGFDRTNMSRFRNGSRVPKSYNKAGRKLTEGLYKYSADRGKINELCDTIGASEGLGEEEIRSLLHDWLYGDAKERSDSEKKSKRSLAASAFGEKLDKAMSLAEISNIRLSRIINTDPSLISRYRSGTRMPRYNSEIVALMEDALWKLIKKRGNEGALAETIGVAKHELKEELFIEWLFDFMQFDDANIYATEKLLNAFEYFSFDTMMELPDVSDILSSEEIYDESERYIGIKGLRTAVIRFLGNVIKSEAKELWLYSDQNMEWMTGDKEFLMKWVALMGECVKKGVRIKIIHNIDRDLNEMYEAITSWLPLYVSGMIEPYYCRKVNDGRFSHTIFLCLDKFCISACNVVGAEDTGVYNFYTGEDYLRIYRAEYQKLMKNTESLISFAKPSSLGYIRGDITLIQRALSLATMPEELACEIGGEELRENCIKEKGILMKVLETGNVYEYIPFLDREGFLEKNVPVRDSDARQELAYSPEQYGIHIDNIIKMTKKYPNYNVFFLKQMPFSNVRILICSSHVIITNEESGGPSFYITHPLMCRAFLDYAVHLRRRYQADFNIDTKSQDSI